MAENNANDIIEQNNNINDESDLNTSDTCEQNSDDESDQNSDLSEQNNGDESNQNSDLSEQNNDESDQDSDLSEQNNDDESVQDSDLSEQNNNDLNEQYNDDDKENETDPENSDKRRNNRDMSMITDEISEFKARLKQRYKIAYEKNRDFFDRKKLFDDPITILQCPMCLTNYNHTPEQLHDHINTHIHADDKKYTCSLCYALFNDNNDLIHHKATHNENCNYYCIPCELAFSEHVDWVLHKTAHEDRPLFKCKECYMFFVLKSAYQNHVRTHYLLLRNCGVLGVRCKSELARKAHKASKTLECCECGKDCADKPTLKSHMYTHIGYRPFQCHYCGIGFYTKGARDSHQKQVHVAHRLFRCQSCGKKWKTAHALESHIFHRHIDTKVNCVICDKKIKKRYLSHHMVTHKEANYSCKFCPRKFTQRKSLKSHMVFKHTDSRPFRCDLCVKAFKTGNCLNRHRRRHEKYVNIDRGFFEMK